MARRKNLALDRRNTRVKTEILVELQIRDIRKLLGGDVALVRAELLKHIQKIIEERDVAVGNWSLLGTGTQGAILAPATKNSFLSRAFAIPCNHPN